jgi:hypothetical protein
LAIGASMLLFGCDDGKVAPGSGVVLDLFRDKPVPQATVIFVCYRQRWFNLMHGAYEDRRVQVTTDDGGRSSISRSDVSGCEYGGAHAEKPGYVEGGVAIPGVGAVPITKIPNRLFVAAEPDLLPLRLRYLAYPAHSDFRDARVGYEVWFGKFFEAKNIVSSEEYRPQLVATYYGPLVEIWSKLSDDERALVQSHVVQWSWQGRSGSTRIDHGVVTSFCK